MKKEETNDIFQYLLPALKNVGISKTNCKIDVTTLRSGKRRGDIWISKASQNSISFDKKIIGLIEAKHRNSNIGDTSWRDAMRHGKEKSTKQGLNYYIVTNCIDTHRFYNSYTDDEITLDGKVITNLQTLEILVKINSQVNDKNSHVAHRAKILTSSASEIQFKKSLEKLSHIYRSCGLKKGDDRINPTISFVVLKYVGEQENIERTLDHVVKTWDDYGKDKGNYRADFDQAQKDIFSKEYGGKYQDFKDLVCFPKNLHNEHYKNIYNEISKYTFHGCRFDVFGAIYEEFASQAKKREFGEFYTPRHVTGLITRLLLRNEGIPRELKIADPACGTGGFLTEAYKTLINNYTRAGKLNKALRN